MTLALLDRLVLIPSIKVRQVLGGKNAIARIISKDACAENYLVDLLCHRNGIYRVRGSQKRLLEPGDCRAPVAKCPFKRGC
jgi:hypothetical protein